MSVPLPTSTPSHPGRKRSEGPTPFPPPPSRDGHDGSGWDRDDGRGNGGWEPPRPALPFPTAKLGLWLFLAAATVLFSLLLSAYLVRMGLPDWAHLPKPGILWVNTLWLLLGSVAFELARRAARSGEFAVARSAWLLGGAFALLFVVGQLLAWGKLASWGYFLATNPASSFFYLLTALHGLHVLGGLLVWGVATRRMAADASEGAAMRMDVAAIYWHFLLGIWIGMLGLFWLT